jgi:hypothetical protein
MARARALVGAVAVAAALGVASPAGAQEDARAQRQSTSEQDSTVGTTIALAIVAVGATGLAASRIRRH